MFVAASDDPHGSTRHGPAKGSVAGRCRWPHPGSPPAISGRSASASAYVVLAVQGQKAARSSPRRSASRGRSCQSLPGSIIFCRLFLASPLRGCGRLRANHLADAQAPPARSPTGHPLRGSLVCSRSTSRRSGCLRRQRRRQQPCLPDDFCDGRDGVLPSTSRTEGAGPCVAIIVYRRVRSWSDRRLAPTGRPTTAAWLPGGPDRHPIYLAVALALPLHVPQAPGRVQCSQARGDTLVVSACISVPLPACTPSRLRCGRFAFNRAGMARCGDTGWCGCTAAIPALSASAGGLCD
jgi:hypothetical protein